MLTFVERRASSSIFECIAPSSSRSGSAARADDGGGALRVDVAEPLDQHVDLALDQRRERVAVAERVVDREAERLVVAARAEAGDRVDDRDVVRVVAVRVGREHAELGQPLEHVRREVDGVARRPRRPVGEQLLDLARW